MFTTLPDNCCADADFIRSIFGPDAMIKLDLFHGISRISREVKQKHLTKAKRNMFNRELSLIFRRDNDSGLHRTLPTAPPRTIKNRLLNLRKHWEASIPKMATAAITNLLDHAEKGCLR